MFNVKSIRESLNMTQKDFSQTYKIPLGTLQNWEQGRRSPNETTISYLKFISKYPDKAKNSQSLY